MPPDLFSLLLSHHPPEHADRCTLVAGQPVCRRCLALYPLTVGVILLQQTPWRFPEDAGPWLAGLAVPAALEFILERLRIIQYHPSRVIVGSFLLAFPLGRGFARYLADPTDLWFWGLVTVYGIPTLAAAVWRGWSDHHSGEAP